MAELPTSPTPVTVASAETSSQTRSKARPVLLRLGMLLSVLGPSLITGNVDIDAGGITTYSVAGASYGYDLLWTLIPAFLALLVIQEMSLRLGLVTGKGLATLIHEHYGLRFTFLLFVGVLTADVGNITTEFAGIAGGFEMFGVSRYLTVPVAAFLVWLMVVKSDYRTAERIFFYTSLSVLAYAGAAVLAKPDWQAVLHATLLPHMTASLDYVVMVASIAGTTVAPWMLFFLQSAVIEKGLALKDYKNCRVDILLGSLFTIAVAFFIMVACGASLHPAGLAITDARTAALALRPLAGELAYVLFAIGFITASLLAATILPLCSAFYACQALGFRSGLNYEWHEAPQFYRLYTALLLLGAILPLIPGIPLIDLTIWAQVANGFVLPIVLVVMMHITGNRQVMGEFRSNWRARWLGWTVISFLIAINAGLLLVSLG